VPLRTSLGSPQPEPKNLLIVLVRIQATRMHAILSPDDFYSAFEHEFPI